MNEERREEGSPEMEPGPFLARFRRRSLALVALRLSFVAVLIGEAVRWLTVALNARSRHRLPVLTLAPFILLALVLAARRRWSPGLTARRADHTLGLRDRLTSFVDFASRADVAPAFRLAQARESAAALARHLPLRVPRLPWYLSFGPALLVASVVYPLLLGGGPSHQGGLRGTGRHAPDTPFPGDGSPDDPRDRGADSAKDSPKSPEEKKAGETPLPPPTADVKLPALPEGDPRTAKEGDAARRPVTDIRGQQSSPLQSFRLGQQLSRVVDLRSGQPVAGKKAPRSGSTFRLFPASDRKGAGGRAKLSDGSSGGITIDLSAVPERYRPVVERYFTLLEKED
jgi:hypothetical protein